MALPVYLLCIGSAVNLAAVPQELFAVHQLLNKAAERGDIQLVAFQFSTLNNVSEVLKTYAGRIDFFHYAGHANEGGVLLNDEEFARSEGIKQWFKGQASPKVVFLNGCSTYGQIDGWLEVGVQAVVATSTPIDDDEAYEFAISFYTSFTDHGTVRDAFRGAVAEVKLKYAGLSINPEPETRSIFILPHESRGNQPPWGLYLHPETGRHGANYRIPFWSKSIINTIKDANYQSGVETENYYLLDLLRALVNFENRIFEAVKSAGSNEGKLFNIVVEHYPWTIGAQLSLILRAIRPQERFAAMVSSYYMLMCTLHYLSLSEWWRLHELHSKELNVRPRPLPFDPEDKDSYPFLKHEGRFLALEGYLEGNTKSRLVPELSQLARELQSDPLLIQAREHFRQFNSRDKVQDIEVSSKDYRFTEYYLAACLRAAAFLANYKMMAIRDISVNHYKGQPATYLHAVGELYANQNSALRMNRKPEDAAYFYYCKSVVLAPRQVLSGETLLPYLSLSPLIIDLNSYFNPRRIDNMSLRIYTYSYSSEGKDFYHSTHHMLFDWPGTRGSIIHTQMNEHELNLGEASAQLPPATKEDSPIVLERVDELLKRLQQDLIAP